MTKLTHYGIIGCGMMGQEHLKNIALLENTVIEAIYEPDAEMAKKALELAPHAIFTNSLDELLDNNGDIDTKKALHIMMVGEKPGGDMERSVPIGTIETALWDAISKSKKLPLYEYLSQKFPNYNSTNKMFCYVGGGYYDDGKTINDLKDEIKNNFEKIFGKLYNVYKK